MAMLTGAFDVSQDQPNRRFLIMAGFISDAGRWADFDRKWRERLAADDLPYFHMNLFAQSKRIFRGWEKQEDKRRKLLCDLLDIIVEHAYHKFATAVLVEAFGRLSLEVRKEFAPTPIAAAGRFIAGLVFRWRDRERYRGVPEFVFEDGDEDRGSLIDVMKELTGKEPIFRPKKDDPEKQIVAFTPLQAADILAYEVKQITDETNAAGRAA